MVFIGTIPELHAPEQLISDVRVARRGHQGRKPIQARKNSILDHTLFDVTWPSDNAGYPESAFRNCALRAFEGCHAAIRPSEYFRAVIRGKDDDGVIGLADVIEML